VTTLEPLTDFYEAEGYHQKYYANNPYQSYCQVMIPPKLSKLRKQFGELLKSHSKGGS
jgi:peptide-methionine (S)-S-oxide reductase